MPFQANPGAESHSGMDLAGRCRWMSERNMRQLLSVDHVVGVDLDSLDRMYQVRTRTRPACIRTGYRQSLLTSE